MSAEQLSRRAFLRRAGIVGVGVAAVLAGCQPKVVEVTKIVEKEVEKVVKETVEVEKEKVVKETVVVEKEAPKPTEGPFDLVGWSVHGMNPADTASKPKQDVVLGIFKDMHPNATFKFADMGWDEVLRQNLVTALLGGTAPDIIVNESFIKPYAKIGAYLPMDETIADIKDNLVPGTYQAAVWDGKVYGIAQVTQAFGFESNPNVVEKAGLDPKVWPKTWSELLDRCNQITKAGNGEYYGYTLQGPVGFLVGGAMRYSVYMAQAKADLCKDNCEYPWFDNPAGERVYSFLREINRFTPPGLTFNPDEGQVYTQLFKGISAYQVCGGWHVKWAKDSGLENAMYGPIPIPDKDGVVATTPVANVIILTLSGTKHPAEALDFCKIFARDEVTKFNLPLYGLLPPTYSGLKAAKAEADANVQVFIDLMMSAAMGLMPQWPKEPNKIWGIFNDLMMKVLSTEDPIPALQAAAQAEADKVMQAS